jgi:hypothetical protein
MTRFRSFNVLAFALAALLFPSGTRASGAAYLSRHPGYSAGAKTAQDKAGRAAA